MGKNLNYVLKYMFWDTSNIYNSAKSWMHRYIYFFVTEI